MRVVFLDTGPLGMVSNPKSSPENEECRQWLKRLVDGGTRVIVPEIADYEVRRELVRAGKSAGIARLDRLQESLDYVPITTAAMLVAANLWAEARRAGLPTAADPALDGDAILAAQALTYGLRNGEELIATANVGHLSRFVNAKDWREIA